MKIWPAPGRRVRDPATGQLLTARGLIMPALSAFWRRRLADGDVVDAQPAPPTKPPKPATPRSSSAKRDSAINPESPAR